MLRLLYVGVLGLFGCASTGPSSSRSKTPVTAESVAQDLVVSLQASAGELEQLSATFQSRTSTSSEKADASMRLVALARELLDNTTIMRGCAKWARYQNQLGVSYAKHRCEAHYDQERWLQLHTALELLRTYPNSQSADFAIGFASSLVHDVRTATHVRAAAIALLDALAVLDPKAAADSALARRELDARERFHQDNAGPLSDLSDNLLLCFSGRDRDLDVIFEVNPRGTVARVHSPTSNDSLERCVVRFTMQEEFRMRSEQNLVFRIHVRYRSDV